MAWPRLVRPGRLVLLLVTGCASPSIRAPIDLSGPDWTRREGQAVWQPQRAAAGVAGELLVATHPNGSALIQFIKPPLPFAIAQRTSNSWQIQFFAQNQSYSGPGRPPSRILWLQLPDALAGHPAKGLRFAQRDASRWVLENPARGETLSGFLTTTQLPATHLVRPGETLPELALWYGIPAETIEAANAGPPPAWFKVGNRIRLPSLKATSTAP